MRRAVDVFADMGKLNMAAKQLKDMAELYEKDDDKKNAMECYEQVRQSLCVFNCTHATILLRMVCMCVCVCADGWLTDFPHTICNVLCQSLLTLPNVGNRCTHGFVCVYVGIYMCV